MDASADAPDELRTEPGAGADHTQEVQVRESRSVTGASLRAILLFAVLAALSLAAPGLGLLIAPLLPLPMAMLMLGHGARPLLGAGIGLVIAGALVGMDLPLAQTLGIVAFLLGFGVVIPAALAQSGLGRRFERGGLAPVTVATFAVLATVTTLAVGTDGLAATRDLLVDQIRERYAVTLRECERDNALVSEQTCTEMRAQRDMVVGAVAEHPLVTVAVGVSLTALLTAATSLWLLRVFGARRGLPIRPPNGLREFRAHWSLAYVLAAGLAAIMVGVRTGDVDDPLSVAGICLAATAGLVLVAQGVSVFAWLVHRWKPRRLLRIALWLTLVLMAMTPLGLSVLVTLALVDLWTDLRGRASSAD